jgi:hypothetical protein
MMRPLNAKQIALYTALGLGEVLTQPHIHRRALGRLKALGLAHPCDRCGGCGMYGPLSVYEGRCFKCNGGGQFIPKITDELIVKAALAFANGGLEEYFEANRIAREAREALKNVCPRGIHMERFTNPIPIG